MPNNLRRDTASRNNLVRRTNLLEHTNVPVLNTIL